ncbi:MAG: glycosyltransferase [Sulfurimonas sp.]|nr:glycosyltransferase [Sulfurimonas sp.]
MNKIFVNATALTTGGGLVTLKQFIEAIPEDCNIVYYIFCSDFSLKKEFSKNNIKYIYPQYKRGIYRIYWDFIGLHRWSKKNNLKPDLIISLQNTTVRFDNKNIPQISYVMQAIPFVNKRWNLFSKQQRSLWFYKNIYPFFMSMYLGDNHYVVTQSKWIKYEFAKKFNFPLEKIFAIRPIINIIESSEKYEFDKKKFNIFCPSSPFVYKNNIEIASALIFLKNNNYDISMFKVYITFEEKDDVLLYESILENGLGNNFTFLGRLSYDNMLKCYNGCDIVVFPSYLETFGLPLLEAASFGKPILSTNEEYAKEVIDDYEGAKLLDINSPEQWGESLVKEFNERNSYNKYRANFQESWGNFFILIKSIINGEVNVQK